MGRTSGPGATVLVGGTPATVTAATRIPRVMVLAPARSAGVVAVTLTNPDGGSHTLPSAFTYVTANAPVSDPSLTSVTPASGPTTGGSAVTLSGVDFQAGVTVLFGGVRVR